MTRLFGIIIHDWPLKLAAVGLATLLYGGLVLSQGTTTFDDAAIPVEAVNQRPDTFVLNTIDPVTEIRYFSPTGRRPTASTFRATVDLANVPADTGPVTVPVRLESVDDEIDVVSFTPDRVTIELDSVAERSGIVVEVRYEPPPAGLTVGETTVVPETVTISGPKSKVDAVSSVRADVLIQASGISVDQDVPLIPVDAEGNQVTPVNVEPRTAHVSIPVFQDVRNKTLPVRPVVTGTPAPGFEVDTITVEPSVVTVAGDAEQLADLVAVETEPLSVNGATEAVDQEVVIAFPPGVVPVDAPSVQVVVTLRRVTATRNFDVGLALAGARPGLEYALSTDRVQLTLGGTIAALDGVDGATLVAQLDVGDLASGSADIPVTVDLPAGVTLVVASPPSVTVTVSVPPTPTPTAAASPGASPSG